MKRVLKYFFIVACCWYSFCLLIFLTMEGDGRHLDNSHFLLRGRMAYMSNLDLSAIKELIRHQPYIGNSNIQYSQVLVMSGDDWVVEFIPNHRKRYVGGWSGVVLFLNLRQIYYPVYVLDSSGYWGTIVDDVSRQKYFEAEDRVSIVRSEMEFRVLFDETYMPEE